MRLDELREFHFDQLELGLKNVTAELFVDLIFGFLDYVDVDPEHANSTSGGDPYILRGRATLAGVRNLLGKMQFALGKFRLSNPDTNLDLKSDYTGAVFLENVLKFGQALFNGDVASDGSEKGIPTELPRGKLPEEFPATADAADAKQIIRAELTHPSGPNVATVVATLGDWYRGAGEQGSVCEQT